jgi:hypothetical protein
MESNEPSTWSYFLWWLASADPDVLKNYGPGRIRYSIIGVSVLVTWMIATLSWGYFFSMVIKEQAAVGVLALSFGGIILVIYRKLIAVMDKSGWIRSTLILALVTLLFILIQVLPLLIKLKYQYSHD